MPYSCMLVADVVPDVTDIMPDTVKDRKRP